MGLVRTRVVLCCVLLAMSVGGLAGAGKDLPVRVIVPVGAPVGPAGGLYDDPANSGNGVFETSSSQLVTAELRASINFFLDLGSSRAASPRDLCVAFGLPVVGTVADPTLVPTSAVCTDMHWNTSDSGSLAGMSPSGTLPKRMQVFWDANGGTYYLRWGTSGLATHADWVTVTCMAQSAPGTCSQWSVAATGVVAHLSYSSRKSGLVDVADFRVDLDMDVARP